MSSLRTLIPPKIASAEAIAGSADAKRLQALVGFYRKLPKGPAPAPQISRWNPISRYYFRHFRRGHESITPYLHFALVMLGVGWAFHYNFHVKGHHHGEGH